MTPLYNYVVLALILSAPIWLHSRYLPDPFRKKVAANKHQRKSGPQQHDTLHIDLALTLEVLQPLTILTNRFLARA